MLGRMKRETMAERAGRANGACGQRLIGLLSRLGVAHFVVSPGSRSTPLALAVGKLPAGRRTVVLDERSAGFRALGRIKATRHPVAVVCTSGTAAAEYFPAVVEAREAGLPLIVLTADRPPELRHCHAGQTIDQQKLYGTYPVFYAELPVPEPDGELDAALETVARRALDSALGEPSGPVHLNCPFREPFFAEGGEGDSGSDWDMDSDERGHLGAVRSRRWPEGLVLPERTLWLAGPLPMEPEEAELEAVLTCCERNGWPILVDGCHALRSRPGEPAGRIWQYDRLLRAEEQWEALRPEAVVVWGEPPTSKVLRQRLAAAGIGGWRAGPGGPGRNPLQTRLREAGTDLLALVEAVSGRVRGDYGERWREAEAAAAEGLPDCVGGEAEPDWFEGDIHRLLGRHVPEGTPVLFANSLAVRDAEWFLPLNDRSLRPHNLRGASGIDGTLSVARGLAEGAGQAGLLVTGDLAFLHDSNGLLGGRLAEPGLLVLLINNAGGGIFDHLPVAGQSEPCLYEELFGTPQEVDFAQLTAAHGGEYVRVRDLAALASELERPPERGIRVVECRIDRQRSLRCHRKALRGPAAECGKP